MSDDFSLQYVSKASYLAKIHHDEFITPEHILMCLLHGSSFTEKLEKFGVNIARLSEDLELYFEEIRDVSLMNESWTPEYSSSLIDVIDSIENIVKQENKPVSDLQLFEALVFCNTHWIHYCFQKQGLDILDIIQQLRECEQTTDTDDNTEIDNNKLIELIAQNLSEITGQKVNPEDIKRSDSNDADIEQHNIDGIFSIEMPLVTPFSGFGFTQPQMPDNQESRNNSCIKNLSENHLKSATHYIGREETIDNCIDTLCRLDKNNIIITGEPGVGKSAFIYGIIDKVEKMSTSDPRYDRVNNFTFLQLDIKSLVAGSQYRGQLEDKVMKTLTSVIATYQNPVIFIDEFQYAFSGTKGTGEIGIIGFLKDYLTSSKIRFIGTCSSTSYASYLETDVEIGRRFKQIKLEEPSIPECIQILKGIRGVYEEFYNIKYTKEALECAVKSSKKYIKDRCLPDKAIDLIDEAGVYCLKCNETSVTPEMIEKVMSLRCSIPLENISQTDIEKVKQMEDKVNSKVYGQDKAVKQVIKHIKINKAGLTDDNKPIGSFLFVGPTGVGKTEVARTIADTLGVKLIKFDMSEYSEQHSVTKLTGSPPSFVGYEEGSLLVSAVKQNPDCVLLLDEIEKAHPSIYNLLLQIMDDAVLTDSKGIKAYFNNVILIMTSNSGAQDAVKNGIGFTATEKSDEMMKHINESFTPEFRGRLTDIIQFEGINEDMAQKIIKKFISDVEDKLKDKDIQLEFTKEANNYIMGKGFDTTKGARGIRDTVDNELKTIISEEIVEGNTYKGCKLRIMFNGKSLVCKVY